MKNYISGALLISIVACGLTNAQVEPNSISDVDVSRQTNDKIPKPKFPDVFQVEIQGIFMEEEEETDASLFYDRENNRVAKFTTYENKSTRTIYDFNRNEVISIQGLECDVEEIPEDTEDSAFPFTYDKRREKKLIGSPEDIFYFTESEFYDQEIHVFPSYVYKAKIQVPQFPGNFCEVTHVFSKQEEYTPTCEGHACQPTLLSISVSCQNTEEYLEHVYKFFRFRSKIEDETVFQAPLGVHCTRTGTRPSPKLPNYFSFSYDITETQQDTDLIGGIHNLHKKIWFDADFNIVRVDEYGENGLRMQSLIYDYNGGVGYTIFSTLLPCQRDVLLETATLEYTSRLPGALFPQNSSSPGDSTVYVGKRKIHGIWYDVWSMGVKNEEILIVTNIYFYKTVPNTDTLVVEDYEFQFSYAEVYSYETNDDDDDNNESELELSMVTFVPVGNFRSKPKEWSAFDVSTCFSETERLGFTLMLEGPPIKKQSEMFHVILEELHWALVKVSRMSIIRIGNLRGVGLIDKDEIVEFAGFILENPTLLDIKLNSSEPDMKKAYSLIERAVRKKILNFTVVEEREPIQYSVKSIEIISSPISVKGYTYSGASLAGASLALLCLGIIFGALGYYVFIKKRRKRQLDKIPLQPFS